MALFSISGFWSEAKIELWKLEPLGFFSHDKNNNNTQKLWYVWLQIKNGKMEWHMACPPPFSTSNPTIHQAKPFCSFWVKEERVIAPIKEKNK